MTTANINPDPLDVERKRCAKCKLMLDIACFGN